ncbi:hypothetical protein M0R89_22770 (plasmid) [Halorussus limi]|uniref:Uncharacterized protein n=1 Tax=Halorussus limi TaxID=2938695 RepID=A0A8U0I1Y1_9EURY|nr:hypothetical protein [Halorussus limi]UPV77198.1 hypothetical protein M0R89_22770 [Halorussus limi]
MARYKALTAIFLVVVISGTATPQMGQSQATPELYSSCKRPTADGTAVQNDTPTTPADITVRVLPDERQIDADTEQTLTICVVNHSNQTMSGLLGVWHAGDSPTMLYLLGPDDCIKNDNSIGVRPIGRSETEECDGRSKREKGVDGIEDGNVIYSYDNGLQPTDVAQYTVIMNISKTGTYLVRAKYGPSDVSGIKPMDRDVSRVTVYCSPGCLFDRHRNLILTGSGLLIGLIGIIPSSNRARTSLHHGIVHVHNRLCNTLCGDTNE